MAEDGFDEAVDIGRAGEEVGVGVGEGFEDAEVEFVGEGGHGFSFLTSLVNFLRDAITGILEGSFFGVMWQSRGQDSVRVSRGRDVGVI